MFKRYLLSSAAAFAPPDAPGAGDPPDGDDRIEVDLDNDETVTDPIDEPEGDDAEDDETLEAEGDEDGEQPPSRQPSRGDRRITALTERTRLQADENARLTRELDNLRRNPPAPLAPVETAAQRAERLALLSPEERMEERLNEALTRNQHQTQQLTSQLMDQSDRASFESRATANPLFKKIATDVERELGALRARGENLPRETIATYLIGQRVLAQQGKAKPGAQQRRRAQETRPVNGRGDVSGDRRERRTGGDSAADIERRFGDIPI